MTQKLPSTANHKTDNPADKNLSREDEKNTAKNPNSHDEMARRVRQALARLFGQAGGSLPQKQADQLLPKKRADRLAENAHLQNLGGHASLRIYWRITLPDLTDFAEPPARGESTLMAMVLPMSADAFKSEEGMSKRSLNPDETQKDDAQKDGTQKTSELPFINIHRFLSALHLPVPAIDRVDMDLGVLLLEDLGDETFESRLLEKLDQTSTQTPDSGAITLALYREAIDLLIHFQRAAHNAWHPENARIAQNSAQVENAQNQENPSKAALIDDCIGFQREFDRDLLRWELDHYLEWGLDAQLDDKGLNTLAAHRDILSNLFDQLVDQLLGVPKTLVLRDYQSRNLMYKHGAWHLIDFQDALIGPAVYDLVALLRDSYIELSAEQVHTLLGYYIERAAAALLPWADDPSKIISAFYLQTVQRKLKDAGRFINIDRVKNNPSFLPYYGPSIRYVAEALHFLSHTDLSHTDLSYTDLSHTNLSHTDLAEDANPRRLARQLAEVLAAVEPHWPADPGAD